MTLASSGSIGAPKALIIFVTTASHPAASKNREFIEM
jgi:hypothetical protein